jgi:hypothetical protein
MPGYAIQTGELLPFLFIPAVSLVEGYFVKFYGISSGQRKIYLNF